MAKPSNGSCVRPSALSWRRSGYRAPWTIANIDCGESPRAARLRTAQRWVISSAARAVALSAVDGMHWSSTIMMSLPIAIWVAMLTSGLSMSFWPST